MRVRYCEGGQSRHIWHRIQREGAKCAENRLRRDPSSGRPSEDKQSEKILLLLLATRPLTRHSTAVEQTCALPCTALPRSAARATQIGSFAAHGEPDTLALRAACAQRLLRPLRARLCAHTRAPQRLPGTTTDLVS